MHYASNVGKKLWTVLILAMSGPAGWGQTSGAGNGKARVEEMNLEQLMNVSVVSAALHEQRTGEAPASVSVITAEEIRKYGYRTLGEALDSVRGLYVTTDRTYSFLGARGFSTPGDFGTRYLLLVNGHALADTVLSESNYLDQMLPLEMDWIEQIEVIQGPGSALYGSNAVLATVNIVTRRAGEREGVRGTVELGTMGEKKAQLSYGRQGKQGSILVAGSVLNYSGESPIEVGAYASPETNNGQAVRMDGQKGYHFLAIAEWKSWTFTAVAGQRVKQQPVSYGQTIFNDRGTRALDGRSYFEAQYKRQWGKKELEWRGSYNWYHYRGIYRYAQEDGSVLENRERDYADWFGGSVKGRYDWGKWGTTTVGMDARVDVRALVSNFDVGVGGGENVRQDNPDHQIGFLAQQEVPVGGRWRVVLGGRYDVSGYRANSLTPRVGAIWSPDEGTSLKLLYGRSFRNPTAYELFFGDGITTAANPKLRPEHGDTYELALERKVGRQWKAVGSVHRVAIRGLIDAERTEGGLVQFVNDTAARIWGVDTELEGKPVEWLEVAGSAAVNKAVYGGTNERLDNSPLQVVKARLAAAVGSKLTISGTMRGMSARSTSRGARLPWAVTEDLTVTTHHLGRDYDLQFGVRNLMDRRYEDPVALNDLVDVMRRPGRSFFLRVLWGRE